MRRFFFNFSQSEAKIAHGDHAVCHNRLQWGNLIEDFQ